jgi:molybdopterin-biosynthesis enzyme MoeA-like protein
MLTTPNEELVRAACKAFDEDCRDAEEALAELFGHYRNNSALHHVLPKVVTLNALYSTQIPVYSKTIPNVFDVAGHICRNGGDIDSALLAGSPEIVDRIAEITVSGKKSRNYFSFATKYCSWHNPLCYPIYDSRVYEYLRLLRKSGDFTTDFDIEGHWKYPAFRDLMGHFREHYHLGSLSFKDIDKFLWSCGE